MIANGRKMDVIANNIANVNTNGYKKDSVIFESFPELLVKRVNDYRSIANPSGLIGTMEISSDVGEVFTYYQQGKVTRTGNRLDFAIHHDTGSSFFTIGVQEPDGGINEFYTRDGAFTVNPDGFLVTREGYLVMGQNGPIQLQNNQFTVLEDGSIVVNGEAVDRFLIRSFANTDSLREVGMNLVSTTEQTQEQQFNGKVLQEFVEESNVNIIREMVDMITVLRAYEANQKMVQIQDGTLEKAVNEVGAVR